MVMMVVVMMMMMMMMMMMVSEPGHRGISSISYLSRPPEPLFHRTGHGLKAYRRPAPFKMSSPKPAPSSTRLRSRIEREKRTVHAMVRLYCRQCHATSDGLCEPCAKLQEYALSRLEACPYQEAKSVCAKCRLKCYSPEKKEAIRAVMRYAGPRMLLYHPVMALRHKLDSLQGQQGPEKNKD